eukprot:1620024-Alexandrium_andersonii.AAC.1
MWHSATRRRSRTHVCSSQQRTPCHKQCSNAARTHTVQHAVRTSAGPLRHTASHAHASETQHVSTLLRPRNRTSAQPRARSQHPLTPACAARAAYE